VFCPECGIRNSEGASFCVRCGASLIADQPESAITVSYQPADDEGDSACLAAATGEEACLVIRSGGGRSGETYTLRGERVTIGRHPDAAIFLDDVTVSRNHAVVVREGDDWVIVDEGSLNGTYVNRRRGDRTVLSDGDEIQIGKYKFTYIVPGADSTS
jgi:pSer/pThr/pTyr-binding forkhead associated (FHA) protein